MERKNLMSHSVLYKWLSKEERLKVKLFFYQTLNEFLNVSAKQEYGAIFKHPSRKPGVHGSIFHNSEKPLDDLGEIAFGLVCKEAGIHRHSAEWDELLNLSHKEKHSLYKAIGKGIALVCADKASKQTGVPLVSSYDYEQFADAVQRLKRDLHLRTNLTDLHINEEKKEELIRLSHHANLKNNPVEVTDEDLRRLYDGLCD